MKSGCLSHDTSASCFAGQRVLLLGGMAQPSMCCGRE